MLLPTLKPRRPSACALAIAALTLCIGLGPAPVRSADGTRGTPLAPRVSKPADAAADPAPVALPRGKDPLDHLRERLAEKLGGEAKPRPTKAAPMMVKLVNRSEERAAPAPASAATPARPPRHDVAAPSLDDASIVSVRHDRVAAIRREAGLAVAPSQGSAGHAHWAYQGEGGPHAWGQLKPEFSTCAQGKRQSPIDIREGFKLELDPVRFDYRPSALQVVDNGHTVQANVGEGNSIEVMGRRYELVQFHFHRPSEERIDGRQFDMVVHLVHKDGGGRLAVVAVLLERGAAQPLIQTVFNNLPLEKGETQAVRNPVDPNALLPVERGYYTYMGSLTTPPCSEGVLWMVMKTPVQVSAEQINLFSRLYPMNARPVQSASGRLIKESN